MALLRTRVNNEDSKSAAQQGKSSSDHDGKNLCRYLFFGN